MSITSINTNQAALVAQVNIGNANTATSDNVKALSSGSRIVNASTDVAALSTGTALQSQVNVLNTALTVASQGSSLLQVADGALAQIQSILQRQQAIATSAQSGSLSDTQRGFLDQEFQSLTKQVDQLSDSTNFNGVKLLNGAISQSLNSTVSSNASTASSGSYTVTTNAADGDTLTINGAAFTIANSPSNSSQVQKGNTISSTVANVVSYINSAASNTNLSVAQKAAYTGVVAAQVGNSGTFTLTARNGGSFGGTITLGAVGGTGTAVVTTTGQGTGSLQQISGIGVASTSTALTSQTSGGFLQGGTLAYDGITLKDSTNTNITIGSTTTLASLVSQINSGTSTSGVSAFITGSASNYTLNLQNAKSASVTAATASASNAFALAGTTQLASGTGPLTIGTLNTAGSDSQVLTFSGLSDGNTVLTEGNSGLLTGAFKFNGNSAVTLGTVTLGTSTLSSLAAAINAGNSGAYTATIGGSANAVTLTVSHATIAGNTGFATTALTGALGNYNAGGRTADAGYSIGSATYNTTAALAGGLDNGVGYGSVKGTGSVLDNIVTGQNQQAATTTINFPAISDSDLNSTSNFGGSSPVSITVGAGASQAVFKFTTTASSASATEIQIGSSLQETLANAAAKINSFQGTGTQNYVFNQLVATSNGTSITIAGKGTGSVLQNDQSTAVAVSVSGASSAVTASTLNNSVSHGIDVSGINNSDFSGTLSGFTATANGTANQVNLSVKVGDITYAANNVNTNVLSDTKIQLVSTDPTGKGGSFSIELQANKGTNVNNQTDATSFASRLNTAVSGLTFFQTRQVSSYDPAASGGSILSNGVSIGSLNGSSISLTASNFTSVNFTGVTVTAPSGNNTNGSVVFSANGQTYTSDANIGSKLNANTTYVLTSATDPNQKITFKTGSTGVDFSTATKAQAFQNSLSSAFGSGGSAISFQIGTNSTDTIGVSIGSAASSSLFAGQALDVKSQNDASNAASVLQTALNTVTSLRAGVGALEERFNFASNAIQNAAQNQGAAKSTLLDTDVASSSTAFATSQVQLQAGIAILAQANQLQQNLLKLIP